jgi:hypothetical protein
MTYTYIEPVSEKYKIDGSVTINENRTNDIQRSKIIGSSNQQQQQTQSFDKLQNKPFWIWNIEEHKLEDLRTKGECCFNHNVIVLFHDNIKNDCHCVGLKSPLPPSS